MKRFNLFLLLLCSSVTAFSSTHFEPPKKRGVIDNMQAFTKDLHELLTMLMMCGGAAMMFLAVAQLQRHFQNSEDVRLSMVIATFVAGLVLVLFACLPFPDGGK